MREIERIRNELQEINLAVLSLEQLFDFEGKMNLTLQGQGEISNIFTEIENKVHELHGEIQTKNLEEQQDVSKNNITFNNITLKLDKKIKEYESNKSDENASSVFKLDIYDRNIEDNLYILYYFFSYGILGLFIYKIIKQ
tara:strand:+ start:1875 stop:2294 length:420 start_codon:yes stop_codon:yes gene_type:complete